MKRHGRSHVLEREPAAGGHIIEGQADEGRRVQHAPIAASTTRTNRVVHTLPVLLTVDEAADLLRTTTARDLRDDRASAIARRDPRPPASAPARRRFARLAGPEARAIARGVTGDERHNPSVSRRRLGSGHPCRLARRHATQARAQARADFVAHRLSGDGLRPGNACCSKGFSLRQRINHARRCPPYKSSRRDSSTATHGRIDRSRAGLHRRP